jgi:hypothetical protein
MVCQPILELLAYLRANGFKTFIEASPLTGKKPWQDR